MSDIAAARMDIEQGLRRAVEGGQLTLRFQPLFSLADGRPSGVEALVRWVHPKRGILLPSEFVPVAEDTGIIEEIDDWVLRKSCTVMAGWLRAGGPRIRLAVNVCARQMVREGYLRTIRAALGETGFPPELLEIEITETALQRIEPRISILPEIRALGAHIAIDDFGTGYSSLARLRTLPFDRIKIDQSFVAGIAHNSGDLAIVTAIVGLSHTLGLRCTAEGVETQRQLELLKQAGCQEAQGFLLGRPLPFEQMLQMRWWS
jgi:EAL domain-containing protein (putative c-di-GMP-specific phosphodiesterase class I)